jgi:hypothetical protein
MKVERKGNDEIIKYNHFASGIRIPTSDSGDRSFYYRSNSIELDIWYCVQNNINVWYNDMRQTGKTTKLLILANYLTRELGKKVIFLSRDSESSGFVVEYSKNIIELSGYDKSCKETVRFMDAEEFVSQYKNTTVSSDIADYIFIDDFEYFDDFKDVYNIVNRFIDHTMVKVVLFSTVNDTREVIDYFLERSFEWTSGYLDRVDIINTLGLEMNEYTFPCDKFAHIAIQDYLDRKDHYLRSVIGDNKFNKEILGRRVWFD